jgi:hypothetical protein
MFCLLNTECNAEGRSSTQCDPGTRCTSFEAFPARLQTSHRSVYRVSDVPTVTAIIISLFVKKTVDRVHFVAVASNRNFVFTEVGLQVSARETNVPRNVATKAFSKLTFVEHKGDPL